MPLSPQQRRRAALPSFLASPRHSCAPLPSFLRLSPSFLRRQEPSLANGDQNLTEVDTGLTKVDRGCQKLTPSTPAPTPNPSKTQQNRNCPTIPSPPLSTFAVNPSGTP